MIRRFLLAAALSVAAVQFQDGARADHPNNNNTWEEYGIVAVGDDVNSYRLRWVGFGANTRDVMFQIDNDTPDKYYDTILLAASRVNSPSNTPPKYARLLFNAIQASDLGFTKSCQHELGPGGHGYNENVVGVGGNLPSGGFAQVAVCHGPLGHFAEFYMFNFRMKISSDFESRWVYGDNPVGSNFDLLGILMHEFAHGLGVTDINNRPGGGTMCPSGFGVTYGSFCSGYTSGITDYRTFTDHDRSIYDSFPGYNDS